MHHNHAHVAIWHWPIFNMLTDYWFTLFQGHPGYVFYPTHLKNHHRYINSDKDYTRTYRYRDDNNLFGLMVHPLESACTLVPVIRMYLCMLKQKLRAQFYHVMSHYCFLILGMVLIFVLNWRKALLFVLIPQCAALFFLLVSNYLQHAYTDEKSIYNHSRNFVGLLNLLFLMLATIRHTMTLVIFIGAACQKFIA